MKTRGFKGPKDGASLLCNESIILNGKKIDFTRLLTQSLLQELNTLKKSF